MSQKINICTYSSSALLSDELDRFKQYTSQKSEDVELYFTRCKEEEFSDYLQSARASTVVLPLNEVPVKLSDGITIAALSQRSELKEILVINKDALDDNQDFRIKSGSTVAFQNDRQKYQLKYFRPDLKMVLDREGVDVYFADTSEVIPEDKVTVKLNPREFIPEPGFGANAWLSLIENIELRKLLKEYHHKDTAVLTNLERKLAKLNTDPDLKILGAYAYKGHDNYFHLYVGALYKDRWIPRRISQTSTVSISENLLEELKTVSLS